MTTGCHSPETLRDEGARLMALSHLAILDTPREETFDRITRLMARALGVPIALVSLVDQARTWFKSRIGLQLTEHPRDISFCGHVVRDRQPLLIQDTLLDQRFATSPLVIDEPRIRAYLGVPLLSGDGQPVGTLCVMDTRPRAFAADELGVLHDHAAVIQDALRAREAVLANEQLVQFAQKQERLFRDSFEQAGVGMAHLSPSGLVLRANQRTCEILGYEQDDLHLRSIVDLTHPDDLARATQPFRDLVANRLPSYSLQKRILRRDGTPRWIDLTLKLCHATDGSPDYLSAILDETPALETTRCESVTPRDPGSDAQAQGASMRDHVRELIAAEARQREAERRFLAIADGVPAMIGYWGRGLCCEFANALYRRWFRVEPQAVLGMHMRELMGDVLFSLNEPHAAAALAGIPQHFERRYVKPDGTLTFVEARYSPDRDESGTVKGFFSLVTDITVLVNARLALESSNARLMRESGTDFLTGLANRREFNDQCEDAAARFAEHGAPYSLIVLDLDNFKMINDRHGHDVGDKVLHAVGKILREELRSHADVAARLGGEELAVLCVGNMSESEARALAERMRARINAESINTVQGLVRFTASFGVAQSQERDAGWKNIFERADAALYRAKEAGKDRVVYGRSVLPGGTGRFKAMKRVAAEGKS